MRTLVLVLVLLSAMATMALAQAPASQVVYIYELEPSAGVRELWEKVVACAGSKAEPGQTFDRIKFFQRDSVFDSAGDLLLGEWVPPDTIFLTTGFETSGWVVAHEMLHHALNGPRQGNPHPLDPFMFPCGLMEFQQHQGGMNGGAALPSKYELKEEW